MNKQLSKDNSGYSLVELLIVMAIIAVLAAAAMVSYTMIHSAKAKDAAIKLNSEVNELKTRCMNMKPSDDKYTRYALSLYSASDGTEHICLVQYNKTTNVYDYIAEEDINLSSSVKAEFTGKCRSYNLSNLWSKTDYIPGGKDEVSEDKTPVYICFDKRGNCYSGYGEYNFKKKNGNIVAHVNIGMNGSISVR